MPQMVDPGSSLFFKLLVDGEELGLFNGCEGLAVQLEIEEYNEGGNNGYVTRLPSRLKHSTLKLTRPLTEDSSKLTDWMSTIANGIVRPTVAIVAQRADQSKVAEWGLLDALPTAWTGPNLDPSSNSVALESLEIVYHGFVPSGA